VVYARTERTVSDRMTKKTAWFDGYGEEANNGEKKLGR